jgi:two-component system, sensor histidine kinase
LAAYFHTIEREQPYGSGLEGVEARSDLKDLPGSGNRSRLIADERVRLFFQVNSPEGRRLIRYLHVLAVLGSAAVGLVVWWNCGTAAGRIFLWCGIICAAEAAITILMRVFSSQDRKSQELAAWAWAKTVASAANGVAWSIGPILLHVDNQPLSVLAPVWGILNYTAAAVWDGAYFAPSIFAMLIGVTLPAAAWLFIYGGDIGFIVSICLSVSLPFWMALGWLSSRKMGEAIEARREIADLLEVQKRQTQQIVDVQRERNRFFSAASHDLRQPLHAMGLYNSLFERTKDEVEREELQGRLSECAANLDRQFNAIIGVSQTDAAVEHAEVQAYPLQDVFDRVIANVGPEAAVKNLRLCVVRTRLWGLIASELLERVLSNLVSNAIKYTPNGGVLLGARRQGGRVDLYVVDTGIGIAQENIGLIFRDFFQIANPERNSSKGFGLGLGIVRRLCDGMNWRLNVRSILGRGSTFIVQVPLAASQAASAFPEEGAPAAGATANAVDVVFVDDDAFVRDAMGRLLADWEFPATLCETGAEAIALLRNRGPDRRWHVVLDFRLTGDEDGLQIADKIRQEFGDRVRITIMSGETDDALQEGANRRGITLLRKPVKPIRLRAVLSSA